MSTREAERRSVEFETLLRHGERSASNGEFDEAIAALEQAAAIVATTRACTGCWPRRTGKSGAPTTARALAAYQRLSQKRAVERR